ncbi:MAG: hypothetical protein Q7S40_09895 [Opitutaceae bacterium]|nr:hypothetical protein [Opitutaceae bacterium]
MNTTPAHTISATPTGALVTRLAISVHHPLSGAAARQPRTPARDGNEND